MRDSGQISVFLMADMWTRTTNKQLAVLGNQCSGDIRCDTLSAFDRDRRADGYILKQHILSTKQAAKSEWEKF